MAYYLCRMPDFLLIFLISFLAGMLGSLLGIGGGVLIAPGLIIFAHLPVRTAVGTSLLGVTATSVTAAGIYIKRKMTDLKLALIMETTTIPGAALSAFLAARVPSRSISAILGFVLLYVAINMLKKSPAASDESTPENRKNIIPAVLASFSAGFLSGLVGIGGGVLKTPILHFIVGLPFKEAAATSVFMVGLTSSTGAVHYMARGDMNYAVAAVVILGVIGGAYAGTRIIKRAAPPHLKKIFSLVLVLMAIKLFLEVLK